MRTFWKPTEDAFLREHYGKLSAREIGRRLNRSHSSVIARWGRLNGKREEKRIKSKEASERRSGWPCISGSLEDRNKRFIASIIRAAREEGLLAA